jgi:hypothetical protein
VTGATNQSDAANVVCWVVGHPDDAVATWAGLTYTFGKKLVDEFHEMAEEILADLNS